MGIDKTDRNWENQSKNQKGHLHSFLRRWSHDRLSEFQRELRKEKMSKMNENWGEEEIKIKHFNYELKLPLPRQRQKDKLILTSKIHLHTHIEKRDHVIFSVPMSFSLANFKKSERCSFFFFLFCILRLWYHIAWVWFDLNWFDLIWFDLTWFDCGELSWVDLFYAVVR